MFTTPERPVGSIPAIIRNDARIYDGNLKYYFKVLINSAMNLNNPYHNFRHIAHFMWLCFDAIVFYLESEIIMTRKERRELLIAGLFHDFDHTGGAGPDIVNIEMAIMGLHCHCHSDDKESLDNIERLIRLSEYPHVVSSEDLDIFGQIMRDADVAQSLSSAWIQQVIFGLAVEKGKSPLEMLMMQEKFLINLEFKTGWAKQKFPDYVLEAQIKETREYINLLA